MPRVDIPTVGPVDFPDGMSDDSIASAIKTNYPHLSKPAPSSNTDVAINATNKGVSGLGDMFLNAPNRLLNMGKALYGTVGQLRKDATGNPTSFEQPSLTPDPDLARHGLETIGSIKPGIVPQGGVQKGIDLLTQGAVGGALTGGSGLLKSAVGAGMGMLSAGASGATEALGGSPALAATAGMAVPAAAGKAISARPTLSPNAELLNKEGVKLTVGDMFGGRVKRMEDAATSLPLLGDTVRSAKRRGIESLDTAVLNRALEPIGEKLPLGLTGNKAIEHTYGKLGDAYDALLPKLKGDLYAGETPNAVGAPATKPSFKQELDNIKAMGENLPEAQRSQLNAIIDKEVVGQFTNHGLASGETMKSIESLLGTLAKKKAQSDNYHENQLGGAIKEVQAAMRRMVNEVNPDYQGQLSKINEGYANFKIAQKAASSSAASEGVFSPTQLHQAVRAQDKSKDKARFAEGNANMQDLSTAGKAVLPSSVPDSGTPFRSLAAYAMAHPIKAAGLAIPMSAGMIPYTGLGQGMLQSLLTRPGNPMYGKVGNRVSPIVTGATLADLQRRQQ